MIQLEISCKHETGEIRDTTQTIPDHYPPTRQEVLELLGLAEQTTDVQQRAKIQVRLNQGILGMLCPRSIDDKVSERMSKMDDIYVDFVKDSELYNRQVVADQLYDLMQ